MMKLEELKKAVLDPSAEDKSRLILEIGPALCGSMMEQPGEMARMSEMMPSMMKK